MMAQGPAMRAAEAVIIKERDRADALRRAIVAHRMAVNAAGDVRIATEDRPQAEAIRDANRRLWAVL